MWQYIVVISAALGLGFAGGYGYVRMTQQTTVQVAVAAPVDEECTRLREAWKRQVSQIPETRHYQPRGAVPQLGQ